MSNLAHVLFDDETGAAYYLAFDLLLARAPVVGGAVATAESAVVEKEPDPHLAARYGAIKVALLEAGHSGPAWRPTVGEARARAAELAHAAGLAAPPPLEDAEIRLVDLAAE